MQPPQEQPAGQPAFPGYGAPPPAGQPPSPPYSGQAPPYGYYAPPYPPLAPSPQTSSFAIASLVTSIVSWFIIPMIGGIAAVVLGHIARNEIRKSNGAIRGGGLALAGLVLGYIQIAVMILVIAIIIWVVIIFASHPSSTVY